MPLAHLAGGQRQAFQRPVDQACHQGCAPQGQCQCQAQPSQPSRAAQRSEPLGVHLQPITVTLDLEADPQAVDLVHLGGDQRVGPQTVEHLFDQSALQSGSPKGLDLVARLSDLDADVFFVGQRFEQRHPSNRIGVHQGVLGQIDHRGNLVGIAQNAGFVLLGAKHLQPSQAAEQNQQGQQNEGAPKQAELELASGFSGHARLSVCGFSVAHVWPSGTNT